MSAPTKIIVLSKHLPIRLVRCATDFAQEFPRFAKAYGAADVPEATQRPAGKSASLGPATRIINDNTIL